MAGAFIFVGARFFRGWNESDVFRSRLWSPPERLEKTETFNGSGTCKLTWLRPNNVAIYTEINVGSCKNCNFNKPPSKI